MTEPKENDTKDDTATSTPHVDEETTEDLFFGLEDTPSIPLLLLFAFQQTLMTISSTISVTFILSPLMCVDHRPDVNAILINTNMFMCGIATIIQCVFGVRLGIIQGGSFAFIAPIVAMMTLEKWACPEVASDDDVIWQSRMREIQGNLMLASLTQLLLGLTGAVGVLLRYIGPLTIIPTIVLIGISFIDLGIAFAEKHWGIYSLTTALILAFSLFMDKIKLPFPSWSKSRGWHRNGIPVFQLFPIMLAILVSWMFCHILTIADAFPNEKNSTGYYARTDVRLYVLERSPWFYWPYPFQFGVPTVSAAGYVGMLAATITSILESIGDYEAAANISRVPPPPAHAINRGIAMEGLASIISGMVGAGHGTSSYSANIASIGITKAGSRNVFIAAGVMLTCCGVVGKFGAVLSTIPDPITGGVLTVILALISSVGLSFLKFVNLDSMRNLTILGMSLLLGLLIPTYVNNPAHAHIFNTGSEELDQTLKVLLGTGMFMGGLVGFLLDNAVPGTNEDRGIIALRSPSETSPTEETLGVVSTMSAYDLPLVTGCFKNTACCVHVPFSPTFKSNLNISDCCNRQKATTYDVKEVHEHHVSSLDETSG